MLLFLLSAVFIASGGAGEVQVGELEKCDSGDLTVCVQQIPRTPVGLPRTKDELDAHCKAYHTGMSCMDVWIKRCLPTDEQRLVQHQIGGARTLMRHLCNETSFRKDFLRDPACWARVSPEWAACVRELEAAVRDIAELPYYHRNQELCCARELFIECVSLAGRSCSESAGKLLRRMAWVLAQDVAACAGTPRAACAAPPTAPRQHLATGAALVLIVALTFLCLQHF